MKKIGEKYKLLLAAAALAVAVVYFKDIIALQGRVLRALSPIFIGILFALILNIVLNFFERKVFTFKKSKRKKLKRPFNLFVTYLSFIAVVGGILALAVPNIVKSLNALAERLPEYVGLLPEKLESLAESLNIPDDTVADIAESLQKSAGELSQRLIGYIPKLIELSKNIFRGLYNILMGIVLSGFILGCKEKLISQFKKILNAFANQKTSDKIFEIMTIANKKLSRFLAGQSFESLVVGVACFGLTAAFNIPYAALVSLIIGVTNFIPMIGPVIGTIPSALIIMIDSPIKALYFIIIENVVQQLESTFLYPKVVGGKLGISGLWVFASVLVLGNLFGFMGMFLGVPLFACLYTVLAEIIKNKITNKEIGEYGEITIS